MPPTANLEALTCSFCNKSQSEIAKLVAGPGVYICNECVDLCNQIITEELDRKGAQAPEAGPSTKSQDPTTIKAWDGLSDGACWRRWYGPTPLTRTWIVPSLTT